MTKCQGPYNGMLKRSDFRYITYVPIVRENCYLFLMEFIP